ncbi:MAG: DUF4198 domain-containing protein [Chitinophagaceae bacterium]
MKKLLTTLLSFALSIVLSAHEFWLQPDRFIYKRGEEINIRFNVGENFEGENWGGDTSKIQHLNFYYADVKDDLLDAMGPAKGDSIRFALVDEGTAMVTYNSKNSFIQLDSAKFNAYLLEDGLKEAIKYRKQNDETGKEGREFYQRSVKTILQVGAVYDTTYKQQTDLPLDIIPQSNPYQLKNKKELTVRLFFKNEILKGALVKVWHRKKNETIKEEYTTNKDGEISFDVETKGEWMVSCVRMIRTENDPDADWQSYWGSCTWGYK